MTNEGINQKIFIDQSKSECQRSDTTFFIKNLPYKAKELNKILARYANISKVCLNPSKTLAIVECSDSTSAQNIFQKLLETKINNQPVYLEWAPLQAFLQSSQDKAQEEQKEQDNKEEDQPGKTLFVKNLNFSTKEENLRQFIESQVGAGQIKSIKIISKNQLPCGYGFVEFLKEKQAKKAISKLHGKILDEHALQVQIQKSKKAKEESVRQKRPLTQESNNRLIIKNLAFEATKQELKDLFSPYGKVKSVRIPSKATGNHRGFGFVEFGSVEEAEAAKESLQSTHLYGRKLVIEFALKEDSVSNLQNKNAAKNLKANQKHLNQAIH